MKGKGGLTASSPPPPPSTDGWLLSPGAAEPAEHAADPNDSHRLLPDCVLHNVLALLVARDVFSVATCSTAFRDGALRAPHLHCFVSRPPADGVFTLQGVLSRFQNSVSTFHVGDMGGIPVHNPAHGAAGAYCSSSDSDDEGLCLKDVRAIAFKRMTAVFNNLDNLRDLTMCNLHLDPAAFDGFVSAMDRFNTNADADALGSKDGETGRIAQLARLDLRGALFPEPTSLRARLCDRLNPLNLTELTLEGCRTLDDACLGAVVARCKGLVRLCVAGATRLQRPALSHTKLRRVDFSCCTNLHGFACLNLARIEELCLRWCRRFKDEAAASLFSSGTSPRLSTVDFDGCVALRTLIVSPPGYSSDGSRTVRTGGGYGATSLPCLRYLRVGMCEDLTTIKVKGCPHMQDLKLALCVGLRDLEVESTSLRVLSLALLPSVRHVKLCCPNLIELDLTGTGSTVQDADSAYKSGGMGDFGAVGSGGGEGPLRRGHRNADGRGDRAGGDLSGAACPATEPPYVLDLTGCNASLVSIKDGVRGLREGDGPTATGLGYGMHVDIDQYGKGEERNGKSEGEEEADRDRADLD